jgi:hypothetical protein
MLLVLLDVLGTYQKMLVGSYAGNATLIVKVAAKQCAVP